MKKLVKVVLLVTILSLVLIVSGLFFIDKGVSTVAVNNLIKIYEQDNFKVYNPADDTQTITVDSVRVFSPIDSKQTITVEKDFIVGLKKTINTEKAVRISKNEADSIRKQMKYTITDYMDKRWCFYTDDLGRILIPVDKSDIRNKSRLHWLWWKLDNCKENTTGLYYLVEPNK